MNTQNRIDYIQMFMVDALEAMPVEIHWVDLEKWDSENSEWDDVHHSMGFTTPIVKDGKICIEICPAQTDAQTSQLNEEDFVDFLMSMRVHIHLHIIHWDVPFPLNELKILSEQRGLAEKSFSVYEEVASG